MFTDCLGASNTIVLRHEDFEQNDNVYRECNNGAVTATLHHIEDSNVCISQLRVNVTTSMYGHTITCVHDHNDGRKPTLIGIEKIEGMLVHNNRILARLLLVTDLTLLKSHLHVYLNQWHRMQMEL